MPKRFIFSDEDEKTVRDWLHNEVYPAEIIKQKANEKNPSIFQVECWEAGYPYEGAIGGGLTYCFTPTALGLVTIVKYGGEYELNLTDYDSW